MNREITTPEISHGTQGLLHRTEARFLYDRPSYLGPGKYADLGTFCGRSAILMAGGLMERGIEGSVVTVDTFTHNTVQKKYRLKNEEPIDHVKQILRMKRVDDLVYVLQMTTLEAAEVCKHSKFKFVFIDADHSYEAVKADFMAWSPLVYDRGEIGFHDTNWPGVEKFLQELPDLGWERTDEVFTLQTWKRK